MRLMTGHDGLYADTAADANAVAAIDAEGDV